MPNECNASLPARELPRACRTSQRRRKSGAVFDEVVVLAELGFGREAAELLQLALEAEHEHFHVDLLAGRRGHERARQCRVADRTAGELELLREELEVDVGGERRSGEAAHPDLLAVRRIGEWELDR